MSEIQDLQKRIIKAAMDLAATRPWGQIAFVEILQEAGLSYARAYRAVVDKAAVLRLISDQADQAMLSNAEAFDAEIPARDRLFDLLIARLDGLAEYRAGLASVWALEQKSPISQLGKIARLSRSMHLALNASGLESAGLIGSAKGKALVAVYVSVFQVWIKDESEDQGATLKALDQGLARAERAAEYVSRPNLDGLKQAWSRFSAKPSSQNAEAAA